MKKIILSAIISLFLYSFSTHAQIDSTHFVTTWDTRLPGSTDSLSILIPTVSGIPSSYSYDVDWDNDGIFDTLGVSGSITHTYSTAGIYTVRIKGTFHAIGFFDRDDKNKIISIDQWGTNAWLIFTYAFSGCSNLKYNAKDAPNLSSCFSLYGMFNKASTFNGDLSNWDVSQIHSLDNMFNQATSFNGNISTWDVGAVKTMNGMFMGATSFNQDLSKWDVSRVSSMPMMFSGASSFDQNLGNWEIDSVTNMLGIFNTPSASSVKVGLSIQNYDSTLIGWQQNIHQQNVTMGALGLEYCLGDSARTLLIADGWIISGDTLNCQTVGIKESNLDIIEVFPNPSTGWINISNNNKNSIVRVFRMNGQLVLESYLNNERLNLSNLRKGYYILEVEGKKMKLSLMD